MRASLGLLFSLLPLGLLADETPSFRLPDLPSAVPALGPTPALLPPVPATGAGAGAERPVGRPKRFLSRTPIVVPRAVDPKMRASPDVSKRYALIVVDPESDLRIDGLARGNGAPSVPADPS